MTTELPMPMHGDGNLSYNRIHITDEDPNYHTKILQPLVKNLFDLDLNLYFDENRGSYCIKRVGRFDFLNNLFDGV